MHPICRLLLVLAGGTVFLAQNYSTIGQAAAVVGLTYVLLGRGKLLINYAVLILPFLALSALVWLFIYFEPSSPMSAEPLWRILAAESNFTLFVRLAIVTSCVFLAARTIPDGETYGTLVRSGLTNSAAQTAAVSLALVGSTTESLERAYVALRAQGVIGPSRTSVFLHLGTVVALTWLASLSNVIQRAEIKWVGNGFYDSQRQFLRQAPVTIFFADTGISLLSVVALVAVDLFQYNLLDLSHVPSSL